MAMHLHMSYHSNALEMAIQGRTDHNTTITESGQDYAVGLNIKKH